MYLAKYNILLLSRSAWTLVMFYCVMLEMVLSENLGVCRDKLPDGFIKNQV